MSLLILVHFFIFRCCCFLLHSCFLSPNFLCFLFLYLFIPYILFPLIFLYILTDLLSSFPYFPIFLSSSSLLLFLHSPLLLPYFLSIFSLSLSSYIILSLPINPYPFSRASLGLPIHPPSVHQRFNRLPNLPHLPTYLPSYLPT